MSQDWSKSLSQPQYNVKFIKDTWVTMRDGVRLSVNIFRPDADGKFPALLSMGPYGKETQSLKIPPSPMANTAEFSMVEAGDIEYFITRGYAQIIPDIRGTGRSEGKYDICSKKEQEDGYDLVEWIAQQPWCNGNVGMIGISYFAVIQYLVAAQQPPHLKAIFPHDGWGDMYRDVSHHGGILMYGWLESWTKNILDWDSMPASPDIYSKEELDRMVEKFKNNEVVNKSPFLYNALLYPQYRPVVYDWLINDLDGPYYWERSAYTKHDKIKIPSYFSTELHSSVIMMHEPGAFSGYAGVNAPKKLAIRPAMPERPFHEFHDDILRWYDHWLKGNDTGIMDEPPIKIWVREANKWINSNEWPLPETEWTKYYLMANESLNTGPVTSEETPDSFNHKPVLALIAAAAPIDPKAEYLTYTTEELNEDLEVIGPVVLNLYASISSDDADFIVKLIDVSPDGSVFVLSKGLLKASHKALDQAKSKPWKPYHTHTEAVPIVPDEINEYAIEIQPVSNLFRKGHRIRLEIWSCDYPPDYKDYTLIWPRFGHLSYDKETSYKIYHTQDYPSHLLLPVIKIPG